MGEAELRGQHLMPSPARSDAEVGAAFAKRLLDASEGQMPDVSSDVCCMNPITLTVWEAYQ